IEYYQALAPKAPPELTRPAPVRALVVGGTDDIVAAELFAKTATRMGEGSQSLIIDSAGHWPHRESEGEFIAKLISFLAATPE
ncbi:MAG TPA: alpha/beta hydrolase, partial [Jatrophihabitantaceae bacterium]